MSQRGEFVPPVRSMTRRIRHRIRGFSPRYSALSTAVKLAFHRDSYLRTSGFLDSHRDGHPGTRQGAALPWINYNAISFLDQRLSPELQLFEFGSGSSTIYFAERVGHVTSVESDREWYSALASAVPDNVTLLRCSTDVDGNYSRCITATEAFYDVVLIDGDDRLNCARQSLNCLTPAGVVILDDSQREQFREILELMAREGFRKIDFEGLKPKGLRLDRTTFFYRDGNCLGI